jgi:lysozyme
MTIWNNFVDSFEKTAVSDRLDEPSPTGGGPAQMARMNSLQSLVSAAKLSYKVNTYEGVTEFTGIILYKAPKGVMNTKQTRAQASETSIRKGEEDRLPASAMKNASYLYTIKCYVLDGPQSIMMPVPPSLSQISPGTDLEKIFSGYPSFDYDTRFEGFNILPSVGDLVKLKFYNSEYTKGFCVRHLRVNHFEALYSMDKGLDKKQQFDNVASDDTADYSSTPVPRASPPDWNKPCLNDQDLKYSASSLRTTDDMKNFIKSWEEFINVPYDYNRPSNWRAGLSSYGSPTISPAIGWGHRIKKSGDDQERYPVKIPINKVRAQLLFDEDVRRIEQTISKLIKVPLTQNQFDAIVSFYFDMGATIIKGQVEIIKKLNSGDCSQAAKEFLKYGSRLQGEEQIKLTKRRKYEASLFVSSYTGPRPTPPRNTLSAQARVQQSRDKARYNYRESTGLRNPKIERISTLAAWARKSGGYK